MMKMFALVAAVSLAPTAVFSQQLDLQKVDAVVKTCIAAVHARFSEKGFDAFYNPATHRVETNAIDKMLDSPKMFVFRKCMTEQGYSLGGTQ